MMIVIKVNRKLAAISVVLFIAAVISVAVFVQKHQRNQFISTPVYKIDTMSFKLKSFLNSDQFYSQGRIIVEVFDVGKGKVIKRIQSTDAIQIEAQKYIEGITGMYPKVDAFPREGYIARIPLEMPIMAQSQWLKNIVNELFIIFPPKEKPYLLILDEKSRPVFYTFKGNTTLIKNAVGIEAEA